jgi:hypothetical protein
VALSDPSSRLPNLFAKRAIFLVESAVGARRMLLIGLTRKY